MSSATSSTLAADHREDVLPLAADLLLVIGRLARRLRQRGEPGISASMLSAMWTVERLQPVTLGELALAERVQPPTITRIAAKLEEFGLLARTGHPTDRRASQVRLTRKGQGLLDRTRGARTAYLSERLASLGRDDVRTLERAVGVLQSLLDEADAR